MKRPARISIRYYAAAAMWVSAFGLAIGACWYFLAEGPVSGKSTLALIAPLAANAALMALPRAPVVATPLNSQNKSAERFMLTGVIDASAGQGVALISLDGGAAQPFGVGTQVAPGYVLHSVSEGRAMLAESTHHPVKLSLYLSVPKLEGTGAQPSNTDLAAANSKGGSSFGVQPFVVASARDNGLADAGPNLSGAPPPRMDSRYRPAMSRRAIPH